MLVAARVAHQHPLRHRRRPWRRRTVGERVAAGLHTQQRPAAVAHRDRLLVVTVEDRVVRLQDLGVDDRARRVERRRRPRRVHLRRQAELGGEEARRAERHQHTARLGELVDLGDPFEPHPAGDVVRLAVHPEILELPALLVGDRRAARIDVEHQPLAAAGLVRDDDDVVGVLEIALAHPVLVDQVVGQLELVERETHPADVLRAAPGAEHRDPRQVEIVQRHLRRRREPDRGEAERLDRRPHLRRVARDDERAGREGDVPLLELLFRRLHLEILEAVAQRDHVVRAVVRDREQRAVAGHGAGERDLGHRRHGEVEHRLVTDFSYVGVAHHPHRPRRIVVGPGDRIGVGLLLEQRLGEAAVRLVALDDVRPGGEGPLLQPYFRLCTAYFNALDPQHVDQPRDAGHVALARRDDEAGERVGLAGVNRVARFLVEVLEDHVREGGGVLQRGQHPGLAVVRVVA